MTLSGLLTRGSAPVVARCLTRPYWPIGQGTSIVCWADFFRRESSEKQGPLGCPFFLLFLVAPTTLSPLKGALAATVGGSPAPGPAS